MGEKKPREARTNYAKNWERLTFYVEAVIRIKAADIPDDSIRSTGPIDGELKAYRDVQSFMENK